MLKRALYALLPTPVRIQGRSFARNYVLDAWDLLRGVREPDIPPRHLNISGRGPFLALGEHNLALCKNLGGLRVDDHVLDVGCGIGRTAVALAKCIQPPGRYIGFDAIAFAIQWCKEHIGKQHQHFSFLHAGVRNALYNPRGTVIPEKYVFPSGTGEITFCLATSVFTHLLPATTEHYVKEVARTLRRGGRFLSTWFLLDQTTEAAGEAGTWTIEFPHRFRDHAQNSLAAPEQAVAYRRAYLEEIFAASGLEIGNIAHGGWSGIANSIDSGQDVIVAKRT